MSYRINLNQKTLLAMDPSELVEILTSEMQFDIPSDVETAENKKIAANTLTKAHAYESFFAEMELKAKLLKRVAKSGKNKEETDRLLGIEEVFKTCKEISKLQIDNVSKIMTLRRLAIDEEKNGSHVT